jgi:hypothetical protein
MIDLINKFNIKHLDNLACKSLLYSEWNTYYELLSNKTNVIIGASNNETGNITYGGDWILESNGEDIVYIYFNNNISNYAETLETLTLSGGIINLKQDSSSSLIQYQYNNDSWINIDTNQFPITLTNSNPLSTDIMTVKFTTDLTFSSSTVGSGNNAYFICGSEYITIDGDNKNLTISGFANYLGLIRNGLNGDKDTDKGKSNITIKNIKITNVSSTLYRNNYDAGGWICQSHFGNSKNNILVNNCINSGIINTMYSGGICGSYFMYKGIGTISNCSNSGNITGSGAGGICGVDVGYSGTVTINNCFNSGDISGNAGGICGRAAAYDYGTVTINDCSNTGNISVNAGGICGIRAGYNYGTVTINDCSNSGSIAEDGGGICGEDAGRDYGTVTINDCSNTGNISVNAGGICGNNAAYNYGTVTINDCSNSGSIAEDGGGICGEDAGRDFGNVTINNCSNSGDIVGGEAGGICGNNAAYTNGTIIINNCSNTGNISGSEAGGICGDSAGDTDGTVTIINCSNSGNILGSEAGGICGEDAGFTNGTVNINNCSNSGNISGDNAGGICGNRAGNTNGTVTINNCYNRGNISGNTAGGITGHQFGLHTDKNCIIKNCYNIGNITGSNSGGICGSEIGYSDTTKNITSNIDISNCYSLGSISTLSGGLLGGTGSNTYSTSSRTVRLTNCYTNGTITDSDSGLIANNLQIKNDISINNCYIGNNNWNDISANDALTGTPTTSNIIGTTWAKSSSTSNTPYVLSCFNSKIYDRDIINNSVIQTPYPSPPGLFTSPFSYNIINTLIYNQQLISSLYTDNKITIDSTTGSITFANNVGPYGAKYTVYVFVAQYLNTLPYNYNVNTFTISPVSCFNYDTKILCLNKDGNEEYIKIQDLRKGDLVKSYLHGYIKIDLIGKNDMCNDPTSSFNCMYILEKTQENDLIEDLIITGAHGILVDELTAFESRKNKRYNFYQEIDNKKILMACISNKFKKLQDTNKYTYYHFILEHDNDEQRFGVWANGILTEISSKKQFLQHPYEII